ncbi:MAG: biotin--[acetyl-CoA-carboxylase] ligase [Microcystaceae cyanobacterium]
MDYAKLLVELGHVFTDSEQTVPPILFFETIPSTNQALGDSIAQGQTLPIAAIALQQTAGRGQWGRLWQSDLGGLYFSLALNVDLATQDGQQVTLWSAWGIAKKLREKGIPVSLKWPNDLVLENRKLGGIKCETKVTGNRINQVVIGVGINWNNTVPETGITLKSFNDSSQSFNINSLEALAAIALSGLYLGYSYYCERGIEAIIENYLDYFINLGQAITLEKSPGIITGITPQGELKVRLCSSGSSTEIILPLGAIQLGYS